MARGDLVPGTSRDVRADPIEALARTDAVTRRVKLPSLNRTQLTVSKSLNNAAARSACGLGVAIAF
jgi:hypothetical protein